jgi:hypothetical protein
LAKFYIRGEEWSKAVAPAVKAVELEPFNSSSLFRLSLCYENGRQYVKAYDYFRQGVSLLTPYEKKSHAEKQARLREQSEEKAANVVRKDPFEVLPLELIIHIMQIGLDDHRRDLVLNCAHVCRTWNQTLINKCPELWGTLTFRWKTLREKTFEGKLDQWLKGCNKKPHTVELTERFPPGGVIKIPKELRPQLFFVKNLRLILKENKVLQRFSDKFSFSFHSLEHLRIYCEDSDQVREEQASFFNLHGDLLDRPGYETIKTMDIESVDYRGRYVERYTGRGGSHAKRTSQAATRKGSYPKLESLILSHCTFDTVVNPGDTESHQDGLGIWDSEESATIPDEEPFQGRYKNCPLHRTLRKAPNLRHLEVICPPKMTEGRFLDDP